MTNPTNAPQGANAPALSVDPIIRTSIHLDAEPRIAHAMADERIEATQEVLSVDAQIEQFMALFRKMSPKEQRWSVELMAALTVRKDIRRVRRFARKLGVSGELPKTLKTFKFGQWWRPASVKSMRSAA